MQEGLPVRAGSGRPHHQRSFLKSRFRVVVWERRMSGACRLHLCLFEVCG